MATPGYSSASWIVRSGREDAFTQRWNEFVSYASENAPGFITARLTRHVDHPQHYVSFGIWADAESARNWMQLPEFSLLLEACKQEVEEFHGGGFEEVRSISARPGVGQESLPL